MGMKQEHEVSDQFIYSIHDVCSICNLTQDEVQELLEYEVISSLKNSEMEQHFSKPIILMLQSANQLRKDYDLDLFTIVLIMEFLHKIQDLENKIESLQRLKLT